jgi:nucleolar protein 14
LQKRLRDYSQGTRSSCWFSLGKLLSFQIITHVFSVSDYNHVIVSAASLLLSQMLVQCPVNSVGDIASGLLVCSILLDFNHESKRLVPEVSLFLNTIMSLFISKSSLKSTYVLKSVSLQLLSHLRSDGNDSSNSSNKLSWTSFIHDIKTEENSQKKWSRAILLTCYRLSEIYLSWHESSDSYPEVLSNH